MRSPAEGNPRLAGEPALVIGRVLEPVRIEPLSIGPRAFVAPSEIGDHISRLGLAIPASLHVYRGAHDEADADIEAGLADIDDADSMNFRPYFLALRSRLALRRGGLEGARSAVEHGRAILASGSTLFGTDWLLDAQVQCLWADGDEDGALPLAETTWEQTAFMRCFHGGLNVASRQHSLCPPSTGESAAGMDAHRIARLHPPGGEDAGVPASATRADVVAQASVIPIGKPAAVLGAWHRRSGHAGRHVANLHDETGPNL